MSFANQRAQIFLFYLIFRLELVLKIEIEIES